MNSLNSTTFTARATAEAADTTVAVMTVLVGVALLASVQKCAVLSVTMLIIMLLCNYLRVVVSPFLIIALMLLACSYSPKSRHFGQFMTSALPTSLAALSTFS